VQFAKGAEVAIVVERALHGSFFEQYGIAPEAFAATPLSPACHSPPASLASSSSSR